MAPFHYLISVWIKFFFLFTPFFALSMFLTMTRGRTDPERRRLAWRVTAATGLLCLILFFFGNAIFALFGITLDAFRVGAGALLFISAVGLAGVAQPPAAPQEHEDIVVVPLAMPVIIGPATIGTLLVLGVEASGWTHKLLGCIALLLAVASVGAILLLGSAIERLLGRRGIHILSKITGLILAALAAQMILAGIRGSATP
jgi:multiple antibiotic resistance protein